MKTTTSNPGSKRAARTLAAIFFIAASASVQAQSVSEVVTDYNGYWKSSSSSANSIKPDNSNNLLAFTYNGTRYSTGANDALLSSHSEAFTPESFKALPINNYNGVPNGNTKIGLGASADGVANGTPAGYFPSRNLGTYLTDGVNGLDLGTCVANFPAGTLFLSINNLHATNINDGVPDILVTQTADPSGKTDRYAFTDINGNVVGNSLDVVLTNITPVGNWMADFFEATGTTSLTSGYTQTPRPLRLWAADLSSFGINASNIGQITYFKIILSGESDLAFVAYNTTTLSLASTLDQNAEEAAAATRLTRAIDRNQIKTIGAYPNPAKSYVNITHPAAKGNEKVMIYTIQGVLIMQSTITKGSTISRIDLPSLRAGTYEIIYQNDSTKTAQKLVVAA